MESNKKSGRPRKENNKLKKVFTISFYFNEEEVEKLGGRDRLRDSLLNDKRVLSAKYLAKCV